MFYAMHCVRNYVSFLGCIKRKVLCYDLGECGALWVMTRGGGYIKGSQGGLAPCSAGLISGRGGSVCEGAEARGPAEGHVVGAPRGCEGEWCVSVL